MWFLPNLSNLSARSARLARSPAPVSAPQHFGLNEDSSREVEKLLDPNSLSRLRSTSKASQNDTGRLSIRAPASNLGEYEAYDYLVPDDAQFSLAFNLSADGTHVAEPEFQWHVLGTPIENTFLIPFPKDGDDWNFMNQGELFRDVNFVLHVPALGLDGTYQLYDGNFDYLRTLEVEKLHLTHPFYSPEMRYLWFETTIEYTIEDPPVTVALQFVIHIENNEYTDPALFEAAIEEMEEAARGVGDGPYAQYHDYQDQEYRRYDPEKRNISPNRREYQLEVMAELLHDGDRESEWVTGMWGLRQVTLTPRDQN